MVRYVITRRASYPGDELQQRAALLRQASSWAVDGIDFIQLREKDLTASAIAALAREILKTIAHAAAPTKLLVNSRPDIAIATGAHGVHLTAATSELTPTQVRGLYASAGLAAPIITISCHTLEDVERARDHQADAILFAPVFEKRIEKRILENVVSEKEISEKGIPEKGMAGQTIIPGRGIDQLRVACLAASPIPVYALGGVTLNNAPACLDAGAAGIAGIRLFQGFLVES